MEKLGNDEVQEEHRNLKKLFTLLGNGWERLYEKLLNSDSSNMSNEHGKLIAFEQGLSHNYNSYLDYILSDSLIKPFIG